MLGPPQAGVTTESSSPGFTNETRLSTMLFQVAPTIWLDVWRSPDGRTVADVVGAFQHGRVNAKAEDSDSSPFGSGSSEDKADGNLFGLVVGVGADHSTGSQFSAGLEAGVQEIFGADIEPRDAGGGGGGGGSVTMFGSSSSILYGALRATMAF